MPFVVLSFWKNEPLHAARYESDDCTHPIKAVLMMRIDLRLSKIILPARPLADAQETAREKLSLPGKM
jgi:hypothetical protein